jgi:hypothetical protein
VWTACCAELTASVSQIKPPPPQPLADESPSHASGAALRLLQASRGNSEPQLGRPAGFLRRQEPAAHLFCSGHGDVPTPCRPVTLLGLTGVVCLPYSSAAVSASVARLSAASGRTFAPASPPSRATTVAASVIESNAASESRPTTGISGRKLSANSGARLANGRRARGGVVLGPADRPLSPRRGIAAGEELATLGTVALFHRLHRVRAVGSGSSCWSWPSTVENACRAPSSVRGGPENPSENSNHCALRPDWEAISHTPSKTHPTPFAD